MAPACECAGRRVPPFTRGGASFIKAAFKAELLRFPAGLHDDVVESLGLIGQFLDRIRPGVTPKAPTKPKDGLSGCKSMRSGGGSWRVLVPLREFAPSRRDARSNA
jgi:hypothetical protein